jgi:hypothetical protein
MTCTGNIEVLKFFMSKKGHMWDKCLQRAWYDENTIEFLLDQKANINYLGEHWHRDALNFKNKALLKRIIENYKYPENYICFLNKSDFSEYFNKLDSEQKNKCILKCIFYDRYENFKLTKEHYFLNKEVIYLSISSGNYKYVRHFVKRDIEQKFNPKNYMGIYTIIQTSKKIKDIILQFYDLDI